MSEGKNKIVAIMLSWNDHKFLVTCKNTRVGQSKQEQELDSTVDFTVIVKDNHTEMWREVEKTIAAAEKPFTVLYMLFFEKCIVLGDKRVIPADFQQGDFARSILNLCQFGDDWMKALSS